ncbi:MAG: hypothetical protein ACRD7E_28995 [Bryobacteraceae bacterium]
MDGMLGFFRTRRGEWRGIRIAGLLYGGIAASDLIRHGWHSWTWFPWLLLMCGFFALDETGDEEIRHQSLAESLRRPRYLAGLVSSTLAIILMFAGFVNASATLVRK